MTSDKELHGGTHMHHAHTELLSFERVRKGMQAPRALRIAIEGPQLAGKTSLAAAVATLAESLGTPVPVFHTGRPQAGAETLHPDTWAGIWLDAVRSGLHGVLDRSWLGDAVYPYCVKDNSRGSQQAVFARRHAALAVQAMAAAHGWQTFVLMPSERVIEERGKPKADWCGNERYEWATVLRMCRTPGSGVQELRYPYNDSRDLETLAEDVLARHARYTEHFEAERARLNA